MACSRLSNSARFLVSSASEMGTSIMTSSNISCVIAVIRDRVTSGEGLVK